MIRNEATRNKGQDMKLCRYGAAGSEKPGLVDNNRNIRDLSAHIDDLSPATCDLETIERLKALDPASLPLVEGRVRFGAPLSRVGHFVAIGLNYADHAREAGMEIPKEPVVFSKAPSCICGPDDAVIIPKGSTQLDWEVELAFVIGKQAWQVEEADALSYIAGYTICNDISERVWQTQGTGQWIKGKSAPTFGPLGPWLVTPDEIADPQKLDLALKLNGETMQNGNSETMIFSVASLISYLSRHMMLEVGDVVTTGTPPGVGMGMTPQRFLKPGDVMHLSVAGLGVQSQRVSSGA